MKYAGGMLNLPKKNTVLKDIKYALKKVQTDDMSI